MRGSGRFLSACSCGWRWAVCEEEVLKRVVAVAVRVAGAARSRRISVKLRTLLRYAYISYSLRLDPLDPADWRRIRSMHSVRPPAHLANQYFYREVARILAERLGARVELRGGFKYAVLPRVRRGSSPYVVPRASPRNPQ